MNLSLKSKNEVLNLTSDSLRELEDSLLLTANYKDYKVYYLVQDEKTCLGVSLINLKFDELKGHIQFAICEDQRNKGYGTELLRLTLEECVKQSIDEILLVCKADNLPARKIIIKNGGIADKDILVDDQVFEKYWIDIDE